MIKKTFTRRGLFGMLAGLVGLTVVPPLQTTPLPIEDGGFLIYEELRKEILDNLSSRLNEECADLIINGTGVGYPRGMLVVHSDHSKGG